MDEFRHPLFSIFRISLYFQHLNKEAEKKLHLSLTQWCILMRLIDMPATSAQDLAEAVGVHPSSLTQSIKRLNRKGLIFVTGDPRDSRKKVISLTRRGKNVLDRVDRRMNGIGDCLRSMFPELSLGRPPKTDALDIVSQEPPREPI